MLLGTKRMLVLIITDGQPQGISLDSKHMIVSGGEILVEDIGLVHWRSKEYI